MNFFKRIFRFFSKEAVDTLYRVIELISPYVQMAYPIVVQIALLTPNKVDDAILFAYETFGFKDMFDGKKEPNVLLRDLARAVLKKKAPDAKEHELNAAIELAYSKYKLETKEDE